MDGRPDKNPGAFKTKVNRAGETVFVAPDLVTGTLERGFAFVQALAEPFQRAAFMMFLVSEGHPFTDGNGRTARRSEERRGGTEWVSTGRSRGSPYHEKTNNKK